MSSPCNTSNPGDEAGRAVHPRIHQMIHSIAVMLEGCRTVAIGSLSPIPETAAYVAKAKSNNRLRILNIGAHSSFTDGNKELFDSAAQGRIDAFFLSGAQIDGEANLNLISASGQRFAGSFGSSYLYFLIPRVILFREEHTTRSLVSKVEYVSAPGYSEPSVYRTGGPYALVTSRCTFMFQKDRRRFRLLGIHPDETPSTVRTNTGFDYDEPADIPYTPTPTAEDIRLIQNVIASDVQKMYPQFAETYEAAYHCAAGGAILRRPRTATTPARQLAQAKSQPRIVPR